MNIFTRNFAKKLASLSSPLIISGFFAIAITLSLMLLGASFANFAIAQEYASSAKASAGGAQQGGLLNLLPLLLIFLVFYFLIIRPQSKRLKLHHQMVSSLQKGDEVVTAGGVKAVILKAVEGSEYVTVQIADSVNVEILRSTISQKVAAKSVGKNEGKDATSSSNASDNSHDSGNSKAINNNVKPKRDVGNQPGGSKGKAKNVRGGSK